METIISKKETKGHIINPYSFKTLNLAQLSEDKSSEESFIPLDNNIDVSRIDQSPAVKKEEAVKQDLEVLKKMDSMSDSIVKLEMQIEQQNDKFHAELEEVRKSSYENGYNDAIKEYEAKGQIILNEKLNLLTDSIGNLDLTAKEYKSAIESLKQELVNAAVDVAKEVILVEVSKNSEKVALKLAETLMNDIKGAVHIKMKVNPDNINYLKENLQNTENVEFISDKAVGFGGVIILSDIGNIEGDIMSRYEALKNAALMS